MTTNRASDFPGSPLRGSTSSVRLGLNQGQKPSLPEKGLGQRGSLEFIFMGLEIVSTWETLKGTYADKWLLGLGEMRTTVLTASSDSCSELWEVHGNAENGICFFIVACVYLFLCATFSSLFADFRVRTIFFLF